MKKYGSEVEQEQPTSAFYAQPGSISSGTLRNKDLIPRFIEVLDSLKEEESLSKWPNATRYADIDDALSDIEEEKQLMGEEDFYNNEASDYILNEILPNLLEEYAPPGHYFGSHPGDGANFGFWECESNEDEDKESEDKE